MDKQRVAKYISDGRAILGLELGSTRIKAVLIGEDHAPVASGDYTWENRLEDGVWTYDLADAWAGVQTAYANLKAEVGREYGVKLAALAAFGISGMMHGYLPFDAAGGQLAPFRTWRNTITGQAAEKLTGALGFNIPQRWSVAHLYQAALNGEAHVKGIARLTTLAGYIHEGLTGESVLGVGEASGMFPIDAKTCDYDEAMLQKAEEMLKGAGCPLRLKDILPRAVGAGGEAGRLTEAGAKRLDPTGDLAPGALAAPPEGDAGTGMTATNSVAPRTGNVSAGTSVFAMVVLERPLSKVYPQIDLVTTPTGRPVAMVHMNNCTSDINAWAGMLKGFAQAAGANVEMGDIYTALFTSALEGEKDCGGVVNLPMVSGEHVLGLDQGRPMTVRTPEAKFSFSNFARSLVCGAVAGLGQGMKLLSSEGVAIDSLLGHGGYFKTPGVGQRILAAALNAPVSVMETAGEGGPWGMALLAAYRAWGDAGQSLEDYLAGKVFSGAKGVTVQPDKADVDGFIAYAEGFNRAMAAERAMVEGAAGI